MSAAVKLAPDYAGHSEAHDKHELGPVQILARLAIQSDSYISDADFRDAVNDVLNVPVYDAAPDLLAVLVKVLHHVEDETIERVNGQCTLCHTYRSMIRAAIAKAEATQ